MLFTLARFPIFVVEAILGVARAVASDLNTLLLAVAAVFGITLIGAWTLFPIFALYATLRTFSEIINAHTSQVNFLARVIRDNS